MDDSVTGNMSSPPKNGTNASAEQNIDKRSSDEYEIVDNDLSTLEASVEHCNAFAETRDKPEASNESSKNTAHDLGVTLQKQETEKQSEVRQIESLQMNRSSVGGFLPPEYKRGRRNRTKDEPETMFDQRIKTVLFCLAVLLLLGLAFFGLAWLGICFGVKLAQENFDGLADYKASTQREIEDLRKALDFEIKHQCKTESELKLALGNLKDLFRDKGSTREIEELRKSLDTEIKQRRKTESELKLAYENSKNLSHDKASTQQEIEDLRHNLQLAQGNLEAKAKAENEQKGVVWICSLFMVGVFVLGLFCALELSSELKQRAKAEGELKLAQENLEGMRLDKEKAENATKDLQNSLDAEIEQRRKTESELKLPKENLEGMRRDKDKAENDLNRNFDALARH